MMAFDETRGLALGSGSQRRVGSGRLQPSKLTGSWKSNGAA